MSLLAVVFAPVHWVAEIDADLEMLGDCSVRHDDAGLRTDIYVSQLLAFGRTHDGSR